MDATKTNILPKTALFLMIALLLAAPFGAQAQTPTAFVFPNGPSATLNGTAYGSTQVNADRGTITYHVSQAAAASGTIDPILSFSPGSSGLTTGALLYINVSNIPGNVTAGQHTITVNLTSDSPTGITSTITVVWNPAGSSGGTTGQGASASVTSLTLISNAGSTGSNTFNLTDTASGQVNYTLGITYTNGSGWLTVTPTSGYLLSTNYFQQFTVNASPSGLVNGNYGATISITLTNNGNGVINIPVTFQVGTNSGNGSLSANPNPVSLNYVTGSNNAPSQFVTLSSSAGATAYGAQISGASWLLVDGQTQVGSNAYLISNGLTVSTLLGNLPTSNQSGTILVTDNLGNTLTITVNLTINGQNTNGLTLSPSPLTLNAAVGQTTAAQGTVTISSTTSGTLGLSYSGTGITAVLSNSSINSGTNQYVTVYGNATGLAAGTYQGSVTVTLNGTSTSITVNFVVGSGSGTGTGGSVAPTSLQFNSQVGNSSSLIAQNITNSVTGAFTTSVASGATWLTVSPAAGTGPSLISVSVNPTSLAASATPYSGSFTVVTPAGSTTVNVTYFLSSSTVVFANPGVLNISYTGGQTNPSTSFQVVSSDGSAVSVSGSSSQSWVTVTPLGNTTPTAMLLNINASSLANGLNVATVGISSTAGNTSLSVPIVVNVSNSTGTGTGTGSLTLGSSSLTFNAQVNGSAPSTQSLTVTASSSTPYTATASTQSGNTTWLSISPSGGLNTASTSSLTVSVNQAGLAVGNYNGTISLVSSGGTQTVPVTLVVSTTGTGGGTSGNVTLSPTSMTFNYTQGGTVPGGQGFNVTTSSGNGTSISYSVASTTATGGNWLQTNVTSGFTPGAVNVVLNSSVVSALSPGTYTGTVTVSPNGGSPSTVSVSLVVQGLPTVSATPLTINLTYQAGSTVNPSAVIQVSGSAANLSFTATPSSAGFLQVSPASGTTGNNGATVNVNVTPTGLTAGTYQGTVVIAGTSGATGSSTVNVTLTVTAPLPTISAVVNSASGTAGPVSPGEIVSIYGPAANPIGPSPAVSFTLSNGVVPTTLGGVQVLFNGIPAPLLAVSSTQINAVVPYNVAGVFAPYVQVKYQGQSSNAFSLTAAATAPGLFTQNQSGSGPGAILNQDNSVNGPSHPAAKGSVIVLYGTGEGATSPASTAGTVTCSSCTVSQLPVPLLPVTVTFVDSNNARYPANYLYAGEAPGLVAGVIQVDAVVPANVPSGTLQVIVGVGGATSQAGVTVTVQ